MNRKEVPLRENITHDNSSLTSYVVGEVFNKIVQEGRKTTAPHEILFHIFQVSLIAEQIVALSTIPDQQKRQVIEDSERFGLTHDIGRIDDIPTMETPRYNANAHPVVGAERIRQLGFERRYSDFALDHHQFGLSIDQQIRQEHLQRISERGTGSIAEWYDAKYGIAGLATVIADSSKSYPNPDKPHRSSITAFTEERARALIDRQLKMGSYTKGDELYSTEKVGTRCLLDAITYLETRYGVDYQQAIVAAQQMWNLTEENRLQVLWNRQKKETDGTTEK